MISTWITRASLTRQDRPNAIHTFFVVLSFIYLFYNPLVQEDRLRRWSEDVVDHRLRDSVRLAKLYREGTRPVFDKVKPKEWFKYFIYIDWLRNSVGLLNIGNLHMVLPAMNMSFLYVGILIRATSKIEDVLLNLINKISSWHRRELIELQSWTSVCMSDLKFSRECPWCSFRVWELEERTWKIAQERAHERAKERDSEKSSMHVKGIIKQALFCRRRFVIPYHLYHYEGN